MHIQHFLQLTQSFTISVSLKKRRKKNYKVYKPWISKGLMKSIKRKNKLYKQFLQSRNPVIESKYKTYKNKLTHSIRIAKRIILIRD